LRALLRPASRVGRLSLRAFRSGSETALRALQRLTGSELPAALADFLAVIEAPLGDIGRRAQAIGQLLRSDACGFVLVAGPEPQQVEGARAFAQRLRIEQIRLAGAVLNRVHVWPGGEAPAELSSSERAALLERLEAALAAADGCAATTARGLLEAAELRARVSRRDARLCAELCAALPLEPEAVRRVPLLPEDVAALDALLQLGAHVFGV
jgi:anion-transporting  ArsA/GET3 family ATPase